MSPISGVATCTPLTMSGAVTAKMINKIDIKNIAVPAILPMRFKVVNPRDVEQP